MKEKFELLPEKVPKFLAKGEATPLRHNADRIYRISFSTIKVKYSYIFTRVIKINLLFTLRKSFPYDYSAYFYERLLVDFLPVNYMFLCSFDNCPLPLLVFVLNPCFLVLVENQNIDCCETSKIL